MDEPSKHLLLFYAFCDTMEQREIDVVANERGSRNQTAATTTTVIQPVSVWYCVGIVYQRWFLMPFRCGSRLTKHKSVDERVRRRDDHSLHGSSLAEQENKNRKKRKWELHDNRKSKQIQKINKQKDDQRCLLHDVDRLVISSSIVFHLAEIESNAIPSACLIGKQHPAPNTRPNRPLQQQNTVQTKRFIATQQQQLKHKPFDFGREIAICHAAEPAPRSPKYDPPGWRSRKSTIITNSIIKQFLRHFSQESCMVFSM